MAISQPIDDGALVSTGANTSGTATRWTLLMASAFGRSGAAVQNKANASLFIVRADAAPADGAQTAEIEVPAEPGYFAFDWAPRGTYYIRGTNATQAYTLHTW